MSGRRKALVTAAILLVVAVGAGVAVAANGSDEDDTVQPTIVDTERDGVSPDSSEPDDVEDDDNPVVGDDTDTAVVGDDTDTSDADPPVVVDDADDTEDEDGEEGDEADDADDVEDDAEDDDGEALTDLDELGLDIWSSGYQDETCEDGQNARRLPHATCDELSPSSVPRVSDIN
jgi:hypothetical protein